VEIEDLTYAENSLAKHITLKWNPNGLIQKKIMVNNIVINHANVDTIKALIDSFPSDDNESSEPFAFSVNVKKLSVDVDPFVEEGIRIKNVLLNADNVYYASDVISVKEMGLVLDSNISKIILKANLSDGKMTIENLQIQDIDTLALQNIFVSDTNESLKENQEDDNVTEDPQNPLIPHLIVIQQLEANILAREFDPVNIKELILNAKETHINLQTLIVEQGLLVLDAKSNLSNLSYSGKVHENQLLGQVDVEPQDELFSRYNLPLRREAIGNVKIDLDASQERVVAKIDTKMIQLLKAEKDAFNLDVDSIKSLVTYTIENATLKAESTAILNTPYGKDILVSNIFTLDENISYSGDISLKQLLGVDAKFTKAINDLNINYTGDASSVNAKIRSSMLEGNFTTQDFKMAYLHLESKKALLLRDYVALPTELNATELNVTIDAPIHFDSNASYMAVAEVRSNVLNIDANVSYANTLRVRTKINIPKQSLLRQYSKELKWDNISPLRADASIGEKNIAIDIKSKSLNSNIKYDLNSTRVEGKVSIAGLNGSISGIAEKEIKLKSNISSISSLLKSVEDIYTFENLPRVEGSANIQVTVDALKTANIQLASPKIAYHSDHKTTQDIEDLDVSLRYEEGKVVLEHYNAIYAKEKFFSTKPSTLSYKDNLISLLPLWVNDQLKTEGNYDLNTKKGKVVAKAKALHLSHELIDLDTNVDVTTELDGNKTSVKGIVTLLGGDVHYDINQKTFASDSDIIIVQDMNKEQNSTFMDNLSVELQVKTKKPLKYNKDAIHIKAKVDLGIHKVEQGELLVLGTVEILKGGTYIFQNKKFVLEQSFVHFTGNPNKPLLEMEVTYKALNHLVTIKITGSAELPQIDFSSKPSLNKEQILSLILFDTVDGAGTNNGDEMMKMMGGAMAKSALNDLGIKLDHLVLGEGNSVEVGKKLTNKITIIYVNDIVSKVKLKYEHSPRTESVIGVSEESQSYDIIYKRDF
jgi:translocation and assembly module TamB